MNTNEILANAKQAEELSTAFATRISSFHEQVTAFESQALEGAEKAGRLSGEHDPAVRRTVQQAVRNNAKREAHAYHRRLVEGTEAERMDRMKAFMELDAKAIQLEPLFESPVQMLSRHGLGSPERSRYQEQLRSAGPRELASHAQWAVVQGDRLLAAAVLSRLDKLPAAERPMRTVEFANKILGDEFTETRSALRRIRTAVQRAVIINRDFMRGRVDGTGKITMGLARARK